MIYYFNSAKKSALSDFSQKLQKLLKKKQDELNFQEIVILCIGSDRATGDCLGPIIGHRLSRQKKDFSIYGTLEKPVHAKNLGIAVEFIQTYHKNALIIAIDASLGVSEHIGYITLGEGALSPGVGVDKQLPSVGDLFITGIVNLSGFGGQMLLQTTRLNTVMQLADFISLGLYRSLTTEYVLPEPVTM